MQCLRIVIGSSSSRGYDAFNGNLLTVVMSVMLLIGGNGSISSEVVAVMAAVGDGRGLMFECSMFLIRVLSST